MEITIRCPGIGTVYVTSNSCAGLPCSAVELEPAVSDFPENPRCRKSQGCCTLMRLIGVSLWLLPESWRTTLCLGGEKAG